MHLSLDANVALAGLVEELAGRGIGHRARAPALGAWVVHTQVAEGRLALSVQEMARGARVPLLLRWGGGGGLSHQPRGRLRCVNRPAGTSMHRKSLQNHHSGTIVRGLHQCTDEIKYILK